MKEQLPDFDTSPASETYSPDYFQRKDKEKRTLRLLGLCSGAAVLLYILIQNVLFLAIDLLGFSSLYKNSSLFNNGFDMLLAILGIFVPFALLGKIMKKSSGEPNPLALNRPLSIRLFFTGVAACTGCFMLANIISSYFVHFASLAGVTLTSPDIPLPHDFFGIVLTFLRVALLAAVVEEIALRGVVMGNLKKYGELFAISMAAIVFAAMHGNLVQAPFALMGGYAMGYFTIKTGSVWTAITAHAINNALSIVISYLTKFFHGQAASTFSLYTMYVLIFVGMFFFFVFAMNTKDRPLQKSSSVLTLSEKLKNFLCMPTMLLAFLFMIYITSQHIN